MTGNRTLGVRLFGLSFFRNPRNVVMLLVIPPVVIYSYGMAMEAVPSALLGDMAAESVGKVNGALFATAFLTGIFGLFQVIDAHHADRRLVVAGFPRLELLVTRLVTITGVSAFIALVSFLVFQQSVSPEAPLVAFAALVVAGLIYGLFGVLIGSLIPRQLEGSLLLVFVADSDVMFGSGLIEWESIVPKLFPLYYPHQVLSSAAFDGSAESGDVLVALGYLAALLVVVSLVFSLVMREGGGALYE